MNDKTGCTDCKIDFGYTCNKTQCINMCGDGQIFQQKRLNPATSQLEIVYQE